MANASEIIYGLHAARHALDSRPENILSVWIQDNRKTAAKIEEIIARIQEHGIHIDYIPGKTLDRHTAGALHQGIVLKLKNPQVQQTDLASLLSASPGSAGLFLILDGVQDPHNLGACLRTANAAGVDAVILPKDRAASITPVVRKVASGAAENTPVISVTNLSRTIGQLQESGIWIIGTDDKTEQTLYDLDLKIPLAIVLGNEGQGLRKNTRSHCDHLVSLPMHGMVESLNVSVSAGICLYEVLRQRRPA